MQNTASLCVQGAATQSVIVKGFWTLQFNPIKKTFIVGCSDLILGVLSVQNNVKCKNFTYVHLRNIFKIALKYP